MAAVGQKLEQAGVPAAQAAEQCKVLAEVLSRSAAFMGNLISLERNVTAKVEAVELKIENKLAVQAGDINLLKWMTAVLMAITVAIAIKLSIH